MFDLITGRERHLPSHAAVPILVSTAAQAIVIALVAIPILFVTDRLPEIPTMMAFVAVPPAPPPPPPPPPLPARSAAKPRPVPARARPIPIDTQFVAAIEEPAQIAELPDDEDFDGVPGGVEGGIPGGIVGGVVGGLPEAPPLPPPPPQRAPVRVGGNISPPQLLHRVEPEYPPIAVQAHIEGVVILEAVVDTRGHVTDVRVLRSVNLILDRAAERAVRQWRYSPLVLNGVQETFVLTVTLSFRLEQAK